MSRAVPPRAGVFDLDGTLLDSLPLVLGAIAHALEPFGARTNEEVFSRLGGPPERFMRKLLDDVRNAPEAVRRMEAYHLTHEHLIVPFDGVIQVLKQLRRDGVQLAIWTGRDRRSADGLLARHGLANFFATSVCGDDLPTHKPDPAGLREIIRRLGVRAPDALYVGDADVDVLGGAACGVDTVLIHHGREVPATIARQSWRTVGSPREACELVLTRFA